jgi:hypothetical protein
MAAALLPEFVERRTLMALCEPSALTWTCTTTVPLLEQLCRYELVRVLRERRNLAERE